MAYYKKGMGMTYHNDGGTPMNYSAGMDMSMVNKRNMNMLGRMKTNRMKGIVIGMKPTIKMGGKMMMDKASMKGTKNMLPGMDMVNKKNLSGYGGQGKTMAAYNPMKMMGRQTRGRKSMDKLY